MIIYKVKNLLNEKYYIGQALEFIKRKRCHISYSKKEKPTSYFHKALKKYGINNFDWKILCKCDSKNELDEMEFHYIKQYNSYITNNGYNMTWGGEGVYGRKLCGAKNGMYGKKHSKETLKKMSDMKKGKTPWNKDKKRPPFSKEWKDNLSKALKGRIFSEESIKKMQEKSKIRKRDNFGKFIKEKK